MLFILFTLFFHIFFNEIQEYLGHSNISTTADIYAHLKFESKRNIVKTMNEKLNI